MLVGYRAPLVVQQASASLFATFTTAKRVINAQAVSSIPGGVLQAGTKIAIRVQGAISNIVTTPGLIVFQVMFGAVIAFTTGNIQLNATAHTTLPFWLDIDLTCQIAGDGTTAKLIGLARATGIMFTVTAAQTDGANTMTTILAPATNPAQGTGFDSTIAQLVDFFAGFTISNGGNGVRIDQYSVEIIN